jgi:hypothetical protein
MGERKEDIDESHEFEKKMQQTFQKREEKPEVLSIAH